MVCMTFAHQYTYDYWREVSYQAIMLGDSACLGPLGADFDAQGSCKDELHNGLNVLPQQATSHPCLVGDLKKSIMCKY